MSPLFALGVLACVGTSLFAQGAVDFAYGRPRDHPMPTSPTSDRDDAGLYTGQQPWWKCCRMAMGS